MIKRLLSITTLVVFLSAFAVTTNAQNIKIAWGKLNRPEKRGVNFNLLGERDSYIFVSKSDKKKNFYIERYGADDLTLDFTRDVELSLKKGSKSKKDRLAFEKILLLDETIVFFATQYDKKSKQLNLYARLYSFEGKPDGRWEKIETIQGEKKGNKGDFVIQASEDKKRFVVEQLIPEKKNEMEKVSFTIFDNRLIEVYKKDNFKVKVRLDQNAFRGLRISKDNKVYFLIQAQFGAILYSFDINDTAAGDETLREYEVKLNKKDVVEPSFGFAPDGNILLAGFYVDVSKSKYGNGLSGTFFTKVDTKTMQAIVNETSEFDTKFLSNFMSERRARKGKTGLSYNFDMRHFVTRPDGGVTIIAENTYVIENCSRSSPVGDAGITFSVTTCYYTYHYDEVIVISLNPDGTTKSNSLIKKRGYSKSSDDGNLSYSILPSGNNLLMFYNDHYKNLRTGNTKVRMLPKYRKRALAMATISEDGEVVKEQLVRHKDVKLEILPRYTVRTNKGLIMLGYYKKAIKLGRFEVEE